MIRTIWFFLKLGVLLYALSWLLRHPGEFSLSIDNYHIETTASVAAIIVLLAIMLIVSILRIGDWLNLWPTRIARWREKKGIRALTRGFVAIAAGDSSEAIREAKRAHRFLPKTPLKNLLLAQAEQLRGNRQGAAKYFVALMQDEETAFLGLRGLLNQSLADRKYDQALTYAKQAYAKQPDSVAIWRTLCELEARAHNWKRALELLRMIERRKAWPREQIDDYYAQIWVEEAKLFERDGNLAAAYRLYKKAYAHKPDLIPAAIGYVECLFKSNRNFLAERALYRTWLHAAHPDLANLALRYFSSNPTKLVKVLRRLEQSRPDFAPMHKVMAEYAMSQQLWGMAASHIKELMRKMPTANHYRLLQRLFQSLPANDNVLRIDLQKLISEYQDNAKLSPDAAWVCGACHHSHFAWRANCQKCGEFGLQRWSAPDAFVPMRLPSLDR